MSTSKTRILELLTRIEAACGSPLEEFQVSLYVERLQHVPQGRLEQAVEMLVHGSEDHRLPTLGKILGLVEELGRYPEVRPGEETAAWAQDPRNLQALAASESYRRMDDLEYEAFLAERWMHRREEQHG